MEALASYGRQADDETLLKHAMRIKARAVDRCGELLREIEPSQGGRPPNETSATADTGFGRMRAAEDAGLSKRQAITALRVNAYAPLSPNHQTTSQRWSALRLSARLLGTPSTALARLSHLANLGGERVSHG
jgi:hypothetical protein